MKNPRKNPFSALFVLLFGLAIPHTGFAQGSPKVSEVAVSNVRAKLICKVGLIDAATAEVNGEIAKLNGSLLSLSAATPTLTGQYTGTFCVTVLYKGEN